MSDLVCHLHDPQTNNQKLARGASQNAPPANDANVTQTQSKEKQRKVFAKRRKIILRCCTGNLYDNLFSVRPGNVVPNGQLDWIDHNQMK